MTFSRVTLSETQRMEHRVSGLALKCPLPPHHAHMQAGTELFTVPSLCVCRPWHPLHAWAATWHWESQEETAAIPQ